MNLTNHVKCYVGWPKATLGGVGFRVAEGLHWREGFALQPTLWNLQKFQTT